jgi:protein-L-isoaspartate(D-aspartate) O-methyltransferase
MGHSRPEKWNDHYAQGKGFHPLTDAERSLLARHLPAREGATALDVGCGRGELAHHLATLGYIVDAVDFAENALPAAATQAIPQSTQVRFLHLDVERDDLSVLRPAGYDLVILRLSYAILHDRTRTMNRLRERLRPGGAVCVITSIADTVTPAKRSTALDEDEIGLLTAGWGSVQRYDAAGLALLVLRDPVPARATYRDKGRPAPHALTGAGVVVTDPAGRVLLGRSVRGVWELPGGKNEPDEPFEQAAVRELEEETGLKARPQDARLLAILMDATHDIPRITAAVRITDFSGEPTVTEPQLIHRWEWHDPADLPALGTALFTPSAHVLDTVWPGLLPDLPPVQCYPLAQRPRPEDPEPAGTPGRAAAGDDRPPGGAGLNHP